MADRRHSRAHLRQEAHSLTPWEWAILARPQTPGREHTARGEIANHRDEPAVSSGTRRAGAPKSAREEETSPAAATRGWEEGGSSTENAGSTTSPGDGRRQGGWSGGEARAGGRGAAAVCRACGPGPRAAPAPPGGQNAGVDSAGEAGVQFAFQKEATRGWELATGAPATPASASPRLRVEWEAGRGEALEASWESPCPAPFPPSTAAVWAQTHL